MPQTYSRADIPALREMDRRQIFAALRSFDQQGMAPDTFAMATAALLDHDRVPGLVEACTSGDAAAVRERTYAACGGGDAPVQPTRHASETVLARADELLDNRFTFYDETHQLPEAIDWDANPGTGHWGHDLNRFSFLAPLSEAFLGTGDRRYARKAVELILDWCRKVDFTQAFAQTPYVFGSYLNHAIHCGAWGRALHKLLPHGILQPDELIEILKTLHDELAYLEIVTNGHTGNWPTIGGMGMLNALATIEVLRDTDRYVDYCIDLFAGQIGDQILPDGSQYELTPHYQWVVVRNVLSASKALRHFGRQLSPETVDALARMVHYGQQMLVPDGSARVAFNDSDPRATQNLHHAAAEAFAQAGFADLLTPDAELGPERFPYAGVALLRQRADQGDLYLAFDGGPYGRGHQHEDKLGFCLFAYGREFIVDPGRHLYDSSEVSFWPYLKSTQAHSTITIDGRGQNSRAYPESWMAHEPLSMDWAVGDDEIRAAACYELGYGEDNAVRAVHHREIVFVQERFWVIFDAVCGEGNHHIESRLQFAPGALRQAGNAIVTQCPDANLLVQANREAGFGRASIVTGQMAPRAGWYSPSYGHVEPAPSVCYGISTDLPFVSAFLLYPYRGTTPPEVDFHFADQVATATIDGTVWHIHQSK